jgi:hypothetical protein
MFFDGNAAGQVNGIPNAPINRETLISPSPLNGERAGVRGGCVNKHCKCIACKPESLGMPTPHPAFGHLLPVEGRRDATTIARYSTANTRD